MENDDKGFKYTGKGDGNPPSQNWLGNAVGGLLLACICALAIAGTIGLIKWILGA
jgi:hypothetical protein